jgi:hypothetical protein
MVCEESMKCDDELLQPLLFVVADYTEQIRTRSFQGRFTTKEEGETIIL